jgi:hypothetical protein
MRYLSTLAMLAVICVLSPLWAADAPVAVTSPDALAGWQGIVMLVLTTIIVPFVAQYLRTKSRESEAAAAVSGQDYKTKVVERVKGYIFRVAEQFTEKELPAISLAIMTGKLKTKEEITDRLRGLGIMLKAQAIDYFKSQDIDILAEFGEAQLDSWIRSAADKLNPFIGQSTADALLRGGAKFILDFGVVKAREAIFTPGIQTQVNVPAPAAPAAVAAAPASEAPVAVPAVG